MWSYPLTTREINGKYWNIHHRAKLCYPPRSSATAQLTIKCEDGVQI